MTDVSVIVPTLNTAATLPQTVAAVLEQTSIRSLELVVVNDGGPPLDAAALGLEPGQAAWPVTIVNCRRNEGVSTARNLGAARARHGLLVFLDDDVLPAPDWAATLVEAFESVPNLGAVVGRLDSDGRTILGRLRQSVYDTRHVVNRATPAPGASSSASWHDVEYLSGGNCAVRASAFQRVGGFDPAFRVAQDREIAQRLLQHGYRVFYAPLARASHSSTTLRDPGLIHGRLRSGWAQYVIRTRGRTSGARQDSRFADVFGARFVA